MYLDYWRLKEEPFSNSLDRRFYYMTPQHDEGLARMLYAASQHSSGMLLTGGYGTGKTFVRSLFLSKLRDIGNFTVALIDNPLAGIEVLFGDIHEQLFGKPLSKTITGGAFTALSVGMAERKGQGFHNLVVIEEAQLLRDQDHLEQLRLLMNLTDREGRNLLTMIFIGQHDVIRLFSVSPGLLQRLSGRWRISPFTVAQVRDYVTHRLSVAGGNGWIIDDCAVDVLWQRSKGVARVINNLADLALYLGKSEQSIRIDAGIIERVAADMDRALDSSEESEP